MWPDYNSKERSQISFDNTAQGQYRKYKPLIYINILLSNIYDLFLDGQYRFKIFEKARLYSFYLHYAVFKLIISNK